MIPNGDMARRVGRYALHDEIGRGGMAVVYRAVDSTLEREVALKLLHPHLAFHDESRERFQREARAVARLHHPNILEIYDYSGDDANELYIVMEYVRGTTLRRFVEQRSREPLLAEAVALVVRQVALALAHAHSQGVVHRDVKPENILVDADGLVKLSDFGIAHICGASQMTSTGQILGSPAYMSPEHIERAEVDARADIFSVGTILYELAVGEPPFQGHSPHAIIKRIIDGDYVDPLAARAAVGRDLAVIIRRCLAAKPEQRYATAAELAGALESLLGRMDIEATPEESARFFATPGAWCRARQAPVIERCLDAGLLARREGRIGEAIDHFNRVLALEPRHERALAAVAHLSRRKRWRRRLEVGALALTVLVALGAAATLSWRSWSDDRASVSATKRPPRAPRGQDAPRDRPLATRTPGTKEVGVRPGDAGVDAGTDALARPQASRARPRRTVTFTPSPLAVEIVIDGRERFAFGPDQRTRELTVGAHTVTFVPNDPRRFVAETWRIIVPPGEDPFPVRGRLRWQPARLTVNGPPEAVGTVTGRGTGRVNVPFPVEVVNGPDEVVSVVITADGYRPETRQVRISAGEALVVPVSLTRNRP